MQTSIKKTFNQVGRVLSKNSPTILTGLACTGVITTTIFAIDATPKAIQILEEAKDRKFKSLPSGEYNREDLLTKKEVVQHVWKLYIPTALMGALTIGCIMSSHTISARRLSAISGLYSISEVALREYKNQVIKTIGAEKEKEITDEVHKVRMSQAPQRSNEVILAPGDVLCYDTMSGRYFKSNKENIRKVVNDLNVQLNQFDTVTLNDFYYAIGLPNTKMGDEVGWSSEDNQIELNYSSILSPEGVPCLVIDYFVCPKYEFDV